MRVRASCVMRRARARAAAPPSGLCALPLRPPRRRRRECPRPLAATRRGHAARFPCGPRRRLCVRGRRGVAVVSPLGFTVILAMTPAFGTGVSVSSGLVACSAESFSADRNSCLGPCFPVRFKLTAVEPRGPRARSRGGLFPDARPSLIGLVPEEEDSRTERPGAGVATPELRPPWAPGRVLRRPPAAPSSRGAEGAG